jgi:autotransporter-associated beta strand protein
MKLKKTFVATMAITSLLKISPAQAATFDWTGNASENFTEAGNWSQGSWDQWNDYRFSGTPTRSSTTLNTYFGMNSIILASGLTSDIVINSSDANPLIMGIGVNGNPSALISIASDSRNLTINGQYISTSAVTWDVGAGRTLTLNGALNNWFNPAALIKNGAGTATLTQMGNYTGATTVNGGTLNLADGDWVTGQPWNGSGATGTITVGAGATLSTSAGVTQIKNGLVLNGGTVSSRGNTYGFGNDTWGNLVLSSDISAGNSSSSTISSEIRLEGNRTISVGSGSNLTISGGVAISSLGGSPGITKTGDGILTLSGANSYNAATNINGGTLILQNSYNSSGFVISAGSTLDLNVASGNRDLASTTFSGAGSLIKTGSGSVIWGGSSATFALGAGSMIDVREGVFGGGSNANENWSNNLSGLNVASGATFNGVEANVRVDALTGAGTITSGYPGAGYQNFTFGVNNGSGNFSGTLADSDSAPANFVKEGSGTQTLSGANSYIGTTTISGGTLQLGNGGTTGSLSTNSAITNNGNLTINRSNNVTQGVDFSNSISGTGSFTQAGSGTTTLTSAIAYSGTTNVSGGTLVLQGSGGGGTDYNGGNININGASTLRITGERYNFAGEVISFNSTGGGTIDAIASGAGGTVFTGDNTIATNGGAQNLISGVRVGAQNQGLNLNGQTVTFNVASGTNAQSDLKVTGTLWNSGNVIKTGNGRLEFTGNQQYTGSTTVSAGTLIINGNISTSTLTTVENGATIAGSGTIGALTVNAGAFINPGNSPGILNTGDYSQAGTLVAEITGITAGTQHDQINVTDSVTLSGALSLDTLNAGIDYVLNDVIFLILNDDTDAIVGRFSNYTEGANVGSFGGFDWVISYQADYDNGSFFNGNDVALMAIPEPSAALLGGLSALALLRRRRR